MVVAFQEYTDDGEWVERGRLHNGQVLSSDNEELLDYLQHVAELERNPKRRAAWGGTRQSDEFDAYKRREALKRRPPLDLHDEDSLLQRFDSPYGLVASITRPGEDRDCLEELATNDGGVTTPPRLDGLTDISIRLFNWGVERSDPEYFIRVFGDGFVRLEIRGAGSRDGRAIFELSEGTVHQLVEQFYQQDFFDLRSTYVGSGDELPVTALSLRVKETEKWVYTYSRTPPAAVQQLRNTVEEIIGLDQWLQPSLAELSDALADEGIDAGPGLAVARATLEANDEDPGPSLQTAAVSALNAEKPTTRRDAAFVLGHCSPSDIGDTVPQLEPLTRSDDPAVRRWAIEVLGRIAADSPEQVVPAVSSLITGLDAKRRKVRQPACEALAEIATVNAEAALDAVPAVASLLTESSDDIQRTALLFFSRVGKEYPTELRPIVPQLQEFIENDELPVGAMSTLGQVAKEYPAVAKPLIDTFTDRLTASNYRVRNNALASLADLAADYPDQVVSNVDTYIKLLTDDDDRVRQNATSIISRLARTHPERVEHARGKLISLLDADLAGTRKNACWALGRLEAIEALSDLQEVRETDSEEPVRAGAIAALEMLQRSTCPHCEYNANGHEMGVAVVYPEWVQWTCPECDRQVRHELRNV